MRLAIVTSITSIIGHLIFAWLTIWRKNLTYVMTFGSLMKCILIIQNSIVFLHTSKVASWYVHCYELHLWSSLRKIWLKLSKTCDISCFLQYCHFLPLFQTLSQILLREVHIINLHAKTQLLMYNKGGFFTSKSKVMQKWDGLLE